MHPFFENQIRVTYDDESGPEEYERVSRDLAKGGASGRRAFLWLKRQQSQQGAATTLDLRRRNNYGNNESEVAQSVAAADASHVPSCPASSTLSATQDHDTPHHDPPQLPQSDAETSAPLPIGEVVVAFGSSDPNVEEAEIIRQQERGGASENGGGGKGSVRVWERLERSLDPAAMEVVGGDRGGEPQGGAAVFLWYRRGSEDDSGSWSSHSLKVRAILTGCDRSAAHLKTHQCSCTVCCIVPSVQLLRYFVKVMSVPLQSETLRPHGVEQPTCGLSEMSALR